MSSAASKPTFRFYNFLYFDFTRLFGDALPNIFATTPKNAKTLIKVGANCVPLKKANMRSINGNDGLIQQDLPEWGNRVCHRHGSDGQGGRVY